MKREMGDDHLLDFTIENKQHLLAAAATREIADGNVDDEVVSELDQILANSEVQRDETTDFVANQILAHSASSEAQEVNRNYVTGKTFFK